MRTGVYPGSFNPPTIAHLAIAEAACEQAQLDRIELVVSAVALGKHHASLPPAATRLEVLQRLCATRPWLAARRTDAQLVADIAAGYDALVLGADKWAQVVDPEWYSSEAARDRAVEALPPIWVAPRTAVTIPSADRGRVHILRLDPALLEVSATAVRAGRWQWSADQEA